MNCRAKTRAHYKIDVDRYHYGFLFVRSSCFITCKNRKKKHTLKNKIENNSTREGAFHQSEWAETNSSWVTLAFFHFMSVAANAFKLFCMSYLGNIERFLHHSNI